ncbi:TPA: hypothetical protein U5E34_002435 [Yersinia enterocolitica]|nr:hypothetical protein [Yersinia enterocolitica]
MKELDSFTVEQLNDFIKSDHAQCGDVAALARIALAAKRADPVYQYHTGIINEEGDIDWYWVDCDKGFYSQYDNQHRRIVYTTPQLNSPEIPDGWKLVPIEPTDAMQVAAANAIRFDTTAINKLWTGKRVFDAMLAAAPEKP